MPVKGDAIPSQVVCLGIDADETEMIGATTQSLLNFRDLWAIAWRYCEGKQSARQVRRFTCPGDFWHWLYQFLRPGQCTWVFADQLYRTISVLGIWERMIRRELVLTEDYNGCSRVEGDHNYWRGFLVLSDPPSI